MSSILVLPSPTTGGHTGIYYTGRPTWVYYRGLDVSGPQRTCTFCGRTTVDPLEGSRGVFCSAGCRSADQRLTPVDDAPETQGAGDDDGNDTDSTESEAGDDGESIPLEREPARDDESTRNREPARDDGNRSDASDGPEHRESFFHVAGMHNVNCEAFLESRALAQPGVETAEASYVTETIRVVHDPDELSEGKLSELLSVLGYSAVSREETSGEAAATVLVDPTEAAGRKLEDLLGFRYIAGVLFGVFLLMPYVVVLYPTQYSLLPVELFAEGAVGEGAVPLFFLLGGTTAAVVLFTGLPLLRGAYVSLRLRRPSTDLLATVTVLAAFTYGTIALFAGRVDLYFDLAIVTAAVVVGAVYYESLQKRRAMEQLTDLTLASPDEARVVVPGGQLTIDTEDVRPGDRLLVRAGERIPVDGTLVEGACTVDESVVTGESRPVRKRAGDELVGGSVLTDDAALVEAADPPTSSIDRLTAAVWTLQSASHGLQRRANRLAGSVAVTVSVLAVAGAVTAVALGGGAFDAVLGALTVAIAACPWALALSTPLSVATNLRDALDSGVVVSDETVFERLDETDTVVFDKTGTLTASEMRVVDATAPEETLEAAALLERRGSHPAAGAIADVFGPDDSPDRERTGGGVGTDGGVEDDRSNTDDPGESARVTEFETHAWGVAGRVDGDAYLVGHPDLFAERDWTVPESVESQVERTRSEGRLPVVVGREGRAEGSVALADEPRGEWSAVFDALSDADVEVTVLTGDDESAARRFADHPAVGSVFAAVPPAGKREVLRRLQADRHVTMVGDGTNDAPALAAADLGIALGSSTALASDAADVALAADDLGAVETTFAVARSANRRVRTNTALAFAFNAVAVPAAVLGALNPVVAMSGVVLTGGLLAANSVRRLDVAATPGSDGSGEPDVARPQR